ncbi:hypothetical protein L1049_023457 [Liquidambar formosana]|uniref:Cyanobacterial aminoacyl-tRNA synthetase CAAD domain-containing protein n=1 Tax=Liquidambar formosana TaxID=63359 RepID=A0AAP0WYU4_LIQFO
MELCTIQAISNLPHHRLLVTSSRALVRSKSSLPLSQTSLSRTNPGLHYFTSPFLKATTSKETSTGASQCVGEERDGVITLEDVPSIEKNVNNDIVPPEVPKEESPKDEQMQTFEFLDKLNIKFDSEENTYSTLLYGGGALVAVYLASAVVGAIDTIPVFPKLMEVVGLGYTFWFITRYLLFKENRDELAAKIEEAKKQVLGSSDD